MLASLPKLTHHEPLELPPGLQPLDEGANFPLEHTMLLAVQGSQLPLILPLQSPCSDIHGLVLSPTGVVSRWTSTYNL